MPVMRVNVNNNLRVVAPPVEVANRLLANISALSKETNLWLWPRGGMPDNLTELVQRDQGLERLPGDSAVSVHAATIPARLENGVVLPQ